MNRRDLLQYIAGVSLSSIFIPRQAFANVPPPERKPLESIGYGKNVGTSIIYNTIDVINNAHDHIMFELDTPEVRREFSGIISRELRKKTERLDGWSVECHGNDDNGVFRSEVLVRVKGDEKWLRFNSKLDCGKPHILVDYYYYTHESLDYINIKPKEILS